MSIDYKKLGFKSGIEIHQQLLGRKLFCHCPVEIRKGKQDFEIIRELRVSAGEGGKTDKAAEYERKKQKMFKYLGYHDINCLVETDEEPPHEVSEDAVLVALQVSKLLNCKIVPRIEFMRKVVIDGSNVSGFQRTAIVGLNGYIQLEGKKYGVETVCLEEEACQAVSRTKEMDTYNLSRLGIPLIEIATAPDMNTPKEVQQVAEYIGMILRSTGKVRRGIGSIRQDVNISITGRNRVEIKGFQDLKSIPKIVDYEIKRQQKKKEESHVRKAEPDFTTTYLRPMPGAARMYPETDVRAFEPPKSFELPTLLTSKAKELKKKHKLSEDTVNEVLKIGIDFDALTKKYSKLKPQLIAEFYTVIPKEIRRKHKVEFDPVTHEEVLHYLNSGKISQSSIEEITLQLAKGKKVDYSKYQVMDEKEIEKIVKKIVSENKGSPIGALMGKAMSALQGKADGKKVMEIIKKIQ